MTDYSIFFEQNWASMQDAGAYQPHPNPTFYNPLFAEAPFRALIVRLSPFRDVDRSTPHLFLFQAVRRAVPDAYVDMAFFPPQHDRQRLSEAGIPLLFGMQSWRSAEDFDVILVSNAYTLELINLPYMLMKSGIPVMARARDAGWPPILLGGSNALAAQAIVTDAGDCVVDALFFGEGEREVEALVRYLVEGRALPKHERLLRAAGHVAGLWIANGPPEQYVEKAICPDPQANDLLVDYALLNSAEAGTARLQLNFGCPAFCSFCFEGYDRKPYREVSREAVLEAARRLKQRQGAEAMDLYSFNFNTHQDILPLLLDLNHLFDRVGFKSQRVDVLAAMPGMLEAEVIADKRSFTLGIEGISERMRAFLHKSLTLAEIENVLARLLRQKIREIKLFYILTGHETEADLGEFRDFARRLKDTRQRANRGIRIIFSAGLLVRMPFTPLRYDRLFLDEAEWRQITGPVKSACETNGFEFRLAAPWDEYAASQVLALGGHWLVEPLLVLAEQGHCYDLTLTPGYWDALHGWLADNGCWNDSFLGEKGPVYDFPMDFVDQRVPADYLYRKYRQAVEGVDEGYCLGEVGQVAPREQAANGARCLACNACTNLAQRAAILHHTMQHPPVDYARTLDGVMRTKWRLKPVYARLWLPPDVAGAEPAWLNAWVMQKVLQTHPSLADNLLAAQESLFTTKENARRYAGMFGETVFAFRAWDVAALVTDLTETDLREDGTLGSGARFLGWADGFEPGMFRQMQIAVTLPSEHFSDAGQQLRRFLQAEYVPVNLRSAGAGYQFDVPTKARKKKVLFEGQFCQDEVTFSARLCVGPKFDWVGYLRSFPAPVWWREGRVEVVQLEW